MNKQELQKLEKKCLKILEKYLNKKNVTIIAAISGGADSIFLLDILRKTYAKIIVAHFNHQLRKTSDKDAQFVKEKAAKLEFHSKKMNILTLSRTLKTGIEETGRKYRYQFFQQLSKKYKAKYIITAHHADDNLETVLANFVRGASIEGLCGIKELEEHIRPYGNLLRPLLSISKKQITDYLKTKKIHYREDQSNKDISYKRNFIRHKIIPQLKKLNPSLTDTISKNLINIQKINDFLHKSATNWLKKHASKEGKNLKIKATSLRKEHPALQKIILLEAYRQLMSNTQNIQAINLDEALGIIYKGVGNKKKKIGKSTLYLKNNIIRLGSI